MAGVLPYEGIIEVFPTVSGDKSITENGYYDYFMVSAFCIVRLLRITKI